MENLSQGYLRFLDCIKSLKSQRFMHLVVEGLLHGNAFTGKAPITDLLCPVKAPIPLL